MISPEFFNCDEPNFEIEISPILNNYVFQDIISKDFNLIENIRYFMESIKSEFSDFVIIGTGGSINTTNMMLELKPQPNIHIIDSLDYDKISKIISKIDPEKTCVFCITKSGISNEINFQTKIFFDYFKEKFANIDENFYFITTKNGKNHLEDYLDHKIPDPNFIEHDPEISGRFSCFSSSFIYVAFLLNFQVKSYIEGAIRGIYDFNNKGEIYKTINKTVSLIKKEKDSSNINTMVSYCKLSYNFLTWYEQILSESTGKGGRGVTPLISVCPKDQHAKLQLFLEGPKDKFFSIFVNDFEMERNDENELEKKFFDLNEEFSKRTTKAIKETAIPVRVFKFKNFDEETLGYLQCYLMLETVAICKYLEVDPFNQPGVERLKNLIN